MIEGMAKLHYSRKRSFAGRTLRRFLRFGVLRGMRSIEIDPEEFRRQLSNKHGVWVANFDRMKDVPIERLDAIAAALIRDAERLALAEGAGFGLGGMITLLPDASLLTVITLRLIQRLALLYGFEAQGRDQRIEMWKAAAAAAGIDYGKDLAEKQILERIAPPYRGTLGSETWRGNSRKVGRPARTSSKFRHRRRAELFLRARMGPPRPAPPSCEASACESFRSVSFSGVRCFGGCAPLAHAV
jgi:hypothetical protein